MPSVIRRVLRQSGRWVVALAAVLLVLVPLGAGAASAVEDRRVEDGTFTWGVKKSFRSYVAGPIARGEITTSDGARQAADNGEFTFTEGAGTARSDGGGVFSFGGAVRFRGHGGQLDVTLAEPRITVNGNGNGTLEVEHTLGTTTRTVQVADVRDASVTVSGDTATLRGAKTVLTEAGRVVFSMDGTAGSSFYEKGDDLDPAKGDLTLREVSGDPDPDPTVPDPTDPGPSPTPDPTPTDPEPTRPKPTNPKPAAPQARSGQLSWGVKSSFRNYVAGPIAKGTVTTSGHASQSGGGAYVFPQRSTSATPPSATGTTSYRGQITFRGHRHGNAYDLDMSMRNPRVVMSSATRGKLVIDSKPTSARSYRPVTVSRLDLSKGQRSTAGGSVTYTNVPVTLSSSGTKLFSWEGRAMYTAGTSMDPVTFTIGSDRKVSGSGRSSTSTPKGGSGSSGGGSWAGSGSAASTGTGSAPSADTGDRVGAGSLSWGLRKSFRDYITGPIAHGSIAVSGGASSSGGAFTFPQSGSQKGDGGADYRGTVRFRGHGGLLDLSFADPAVSIESASSGSLSAQVGGRRLTVASLDLGAAAKSESGGASVYSDVPATLTSQGATLFDYNGSSFYPAGTTMDPVTFTVGSASSAAAGGGGSSAETVASGDDGSSGSGPPMDPDSVAVPDADVPEQACVATGSDLVWGFKESFRSYVSGSIAGGDWAAKGGATYDTPNFRWAKGKGTFEEKSRTGAVEFPGTVAFNGHDGALNTTISDPEVRLEGDRAVIVLDTEGATMEAAMDGRDDTKAYPDVPFVEVDLSGADVATKGGRTTITAKEAPTKLTKEGEAAFSNYTVGTEFDPVSFTISAKSSCIAPDAVTGTGASGDGAAAAPADGGTSGGDDGGIPAWAAWAGGGAAGALLAAVVTLLLVRRRLARLAARGAAAAGGAA